MSVRTSHNPRSTASIGGHPIHPMLVQFPISFFIATLVCDVVFASTHGIGWATPTLWLLGAGIVMALLAALAGITDMAGDSRVRKMGDVWLHAIGNVLAVLVELVNWYMRFRHGAAAVVPGGLVLSVVTVIILCFTGWKGGTLVYHRHVGVLDQLEDGSPTERR